MGLFDRITSQSTPSTATPEIELLQARLQQIDQRLAQLEIEIPQSPKGGPAQHELLVEESDLQTLKRTTSLRLNTLLSPPTEMQLRAKRRRDELIALRARELREGWLSAAENFARQGDFYSARQMRLNAIAATEFATAEFEK